MMRVGLRIGGRLAPLGVVALMTLGAAACGGSSSGTDLVALRAALASNPDVEVLATDDKAGIFTVRVKSTGQVTTVSAADLAAGKSITFTTEGGGATATAGPGGSAAVTAPGVDIRATGAGAGQASVAIAGSGGRGVEVAAGGGAAQVSATGSRGSADVSARPGGAADVSARGGQVRGGRAATSATPGGLSVTADGQTVTIGGNRAGGMSVTANGERVDVDPARGGVSVTANGDRVTATSGGSRAQVQQRPAAGGAAMADVDDGRPRRTSPYQCGGGQSLRIENERIETSGTAVVVEGGCNVVIRNVHIITSGTGVLAGGASDVTIEDSIIEARGGAVSIQGTATVTASGSTLRGGVRRAGLGTFNDRGGNTMR